MLLFLVIFCVIIALGFGLAAAWSDFNGLIISNMYSACIIAAFVPAFVVVTFMAPEAAFFASWKSHLMSAGVVFAITFILFSAKAIGAGDSKLATAYALWVGMHGMAAFLFFMTVFGGILGLAALVLKKWKPIKDPKEGGWIANVQSGKNAVPYGIAIAFGAIVAFYQIGYFEPEKLAALGEVSSAAGSL